MKKQMVFLFAFITAYTLFFINLPPWWDGNTTTITALDTVRTNIDLYVDFFGKPPFIFMSLGLLFKLFGYSPAIIHLYMLGFSMAAVYFTYKVGEVLSNKEIAIAASFFLAFSPLFIAQSVNLNFDLPAMALVMASYYYLLKKDHLKYAIAGTILVMTKEVGILFIAAGVLTTVFYEIKWRAFSARIIPILVFGVWAYGNYTRHGWFLFPRDSPILMFDTILNENFFMRLEQLFVMNFNWILTFIAVLSIISWLYRHHLKIDSEIFRQLISMMLFSLFFLITVAPIRDFNLPRYVLVLYPALYLIASWAIFNFFGKNEKIFLTIIVFIIALFAAQTSFSLYSQNPYVLLDPATQKMYGEKPRITLGGSEVVEINLKYVDYVKADIELVHYLNTTDHSLPLLLNRFNHYSIFKAANKGIDTGYGQKYPREYKELGEFYRSQDTISYPAILVIEDFNKFDLEKMYNMYNVTFLKQIRVNGVGADVYLIDKDY
jgi:4-amino-4-deoxy-L-arabinose transferase-like glycosyltransferase